MTSPAIKAVSQPVAQPRAHPGGAAPLLGRHEPDRAVRGRVRGDLKVKGGGIPLGDHIGRVGMIPDWSGADAGFRADTGRKSAHSGTSAWCHKRT